MAPIDMTLIDIAAMPDSDLLDSLIDELTKEVKDNDKIENLKIESLERILKSNDYSRFEYWFDKLISVDLNRTKEYKDDVFRQVIRALCFIVDTATDIEDAKAKIKDSYFRVWDAALNSNNCNAAIRFSSIAPSISRAIATSSILKGIIYRFKKLYNVIGKQEHNKEYKEYFWDDMCILLIASCDRDISEVKKLAIRLQDEVVKEWTKNTRLSDYYVLFE